MQVLRIAALFVGSLLIVFGAVTQVARWMDGPLGPLPGGALVRGQSIPAGAMRWSEVEGVDTIELQLLEPPRSRTTWIVEHRGAAYVPCGLPGFWLWKQWPHQALRDGRAVVRIGDQRIPVQLVRIEDEPLFEAVHERMVRKYGQGGDFDRDTLWIFRLDPRS